VNHTAQSLLDAASALSAACQQLSFGPPVHTVYNCFDYAYNGYAAYVSRFVDGPRRALLLGMNPGPWGMAQTGVPFGEVAAVRGWMGLQFTIASPANQHPARPVHGLDCPRSEVSGRRLWGLFSELFPDPDAFFARAFVMNYCPLAFLLESGANLTPDKLPADQRAPLLQACDAHLAAAINILQPQLLIGVGAWATGILKRLHPGVGRIATLLHPSPASPIANRHWPQRPIQQLQDAGFFD
jgi:single-strand selective monofunctional uracil DNA glycosylase